MPDLNKYFQQSRSAEMMRSEIRLSDYNPRTITDEGRKQLRRSIKKYGVVGGIVINEQTGNTVVGGHQKIKVLDELNHYPDREGSDYRLRVEIVSIDPKTEKQLNIVLNNPNVGGQWDIDALAAIVPDIDYRDAGLTEADLNMIGCDYLLKTEQENSIAADLSNLVKPIAEQREAEKAARAAAGQDSDDTTDGESLEVETEPTWDERVQAMKNLKASVKEKAQRQAEDMEAYVMLSFDTFKAKAAFMQRFGYDPYMKIIKGEVFDGQVERIE